MKIPDKPPANVPERREMPILENALTAEVRELDAKYSSRKLGRSWLIYWNSVLMLLVHFW